MRFRAAWYARGVGDARTPASVAAHIRYVHARTRADSDEFAGLMLRWVWPGGHDDRFDPVAVEWVRRWNPRTLVAGDAECGCTVGRCTVCN
jgi:hypothetical protein